MRCSSRKRRRKKSGTAIAIEVPFTKGEKIKVVQEMAQSSALKNIICEDDMV